jgi:S-adenosylmethionine:tRNA ribosyltransferase-isomerase
VDRARGTFQDRRFAELPELLRAGDCLVVNDSRVIPARVLAEDEAGRGVELLFVAPLGEGRWTALARPGRRSRPGAMLRAGGRPGIRLRVAAVAADGSREIAPADSTIEALLDEHGLPPLPPYVARHAKPTPEDVERYQTVYARVPGSIAAPTAGLHFTPGVLGRLAARGIEVHAITLHVGPATFRPIRTPTVEAHPLPGERAHVPEGTARAVEAARAEGRRVVAVGTTVTRTLESVARRTGRVEPGDAVADVFITPGYPFRVVGALVTNFHLPRSSLLALVAAFAGRDLVLAAYRHALERGYRFYSYGDATLFT